MDREVPSSKAHWFVSHISMNGIWFLDDIKHLIKDNLQNLILATPFSKNQEQEDFKRWIHSTNREFNIKSAYFSLCKPNWNPSPRYAS